MTVDVASRIVVTDANVLINFMHVRRLRTMSAIPAHRFLVPDHVVAEIMDTSQARTLRAAIGAKAIEQTSLTDIAAMERFVELRAQMGAGEAACLVLAEQNDWTVASDEKRVFRRIATARLGSNRILTTPDLFVRAIRAGLLTVTAADAAKAELEKRRFKMGFRSFAELL